MKKMMIMMAIALLGLAACQEEDVIVPITDGGNVEDTTTAGGSDNVSSIVPSVSELDTTTITSTGFTAAWEPVSNADSYELRIRTAAATNGRAQSWDTLIVITEGTRYVLKDLESGQTYLYSVRAKIGEDYTSFSEEVTITLINMEECLIPEDFKNDTTAHNKFEVNLLCKKLVYDGGGKPNIARSIFSFYEMPDHDKLEIILKYLNGDKGKAMMYVRLYKDGELLVEYNASWYTVQREGENKYSFAYRELEYKGYETGKTYETEKATSFQNVTSVSPTELYFEQLEVTFRIEE